MKDDTSHVIAVINALSDSENQRYSVLVYWSSKFKSSRDLRSDSHKHPEKEFKISICFRNSDLEGGIEVRNSSIQFDEDWCLTLHQSHIGCNPPEDFETVFFGLSKGVIVYVKHGCKLGNLPRKNTGAPKIHFSQSHWYFDTRESELLMSCLDSRIWENPLSPTTMNMFVASFASWFLFVVCIDLPGTKSRCQRLHPNFRLKKVLKKKQTGEPQVVRFDLNKKLLTFLTISGSEVSTKLFKFNWHHHLSQGTE